MFVQDGVVWKRVPSSNRIRTVLFNVARTQSVEWYASPRCGRRVYMKDRRRYKAMKREREFGKVASSKRRLVPRGPKKTKKTKNNLGRMDMGRRGARKSAVREMMREKSLNKDKVNRQLKKEEEDRVETEARRTVLRYQRRLLENSTVSLERRGRARPGRRERAKKWFPFKPFPVRRRRSMFDHPKIEISVSGDFSAFLVVDQHVLVSNSLPDDLLILLDKGILSIGPKPVHIHRSFAEQGIVNGSVLRFGVYGLQGGGRDLPPSGVLEEKDASIMTDVSSTVPLLPTTASVSGGGDEIVDLIRVDFEDMQSEYIAKEFACGYKNPTGGTGSCCVQEFRWM